jgi:hypothetical protein
VDLLPILIVIALIQVIAYFSARNVLGAEVGWRLNNLLGFACATTFWGSFYAGFFADSLAIWLLVFASGTALVVYGLRRHSSFSISIKQGLLIFGGVELRLVLAAAALGAIARGLIFLVKNAATSPGVN